MCVFKYLHLIADTGGITLKINPDMFSYRVTLQTFNDRRRFFSSSLTFITATLCRKAATHDSEIRHLYEEMEAQIKNEKERLLLKVRQLQLTQREHCFIPLCSEKDVLLIVTSLSSDKQCFHVNAFI